MVVLPVDIVDARRSYDRMPDLAGKEKRRATVIVNWPIGSLYRAVGARPRTRNPGTDSAPGFRVRRWSTNILHRALEDFEPTDGEE
jgi:hypothetical protein